MCLTVLNIIYILGETNYGPAIDMWSSGCVLAEMFTRTVLIKVCDKFLKYIINLMLIIQSQLQFFTKKIQKAYLNVKNYDSL